MKNAFLYVATGREYLEEAVNSASNLIKIDKSASIVLYTDCCPDAVDTASMPFDKIEKIKNPHFEFLDKIEAMLHCDAEKVIFLDTDTVALSQFNLWEVLDKFDLAFVYDPIRFDYDLPEIPEAFPTPNSGFIAFKKTPAVVRTLERWLNIYKSLRCQVPKPSGDQIALRQAIYESDLRFLVLPEEYNLRVSFPHMVPGNVKVKLLHGRHEKLAAAIKATERVEFLPRVYGGIYRKEELWEVLKINLAKRCKLFRHKNKSSAVDKI